MNRSETDSLTIKATAGAIRQLLDRLEHDASWDKCGPLYYELKRQLTEHDEAQVTIAADDRFEIMTKERKRFGKVYPAERTGMFAQLGKNDKGKTTIHLTGEYAGKVVDIKFAEGDIAEYDSYNFSYLGTITKITNKAVTIQPKHGARTRRLDLNEFGWRNHNFNLERLAEERANWSD